MTDNKPMLQLFVWSAIAMFATLGVISLIGWAAQEFESNRGAIDTIVRVTKSAR